MALETALLPLAVPAAFRRDSADTIRGVSARTAISDLRDFSDMGAWCRGALILGALCAAAVQLGSGVEPLPGGAPEPMSDDQWAQFDALRLVPLAGAAGTPERIAPSKAVELLDVPPIPRVVEDTVRLGSRETLPTALVRAGIAPGEAQRIGSLLGSGEVKPGALIEARLGPVPEGGGARPLEHVLIRASLDLRLRVERRDGRLSVTRTAVKVDRTPLRIQQAVGRDLEQSLLIAGIPAAIAREFVWEVGRRANVSKLSPDDRFDLIMEQRTAATGERESGRLLYAGILRKGAPPLRIMRWDGPAPAPLPERSAMLARPVEGRITSGFGSRRHPILGLRRFHRGVDIRAAFGTPIQAVADGRIILAGWNGGYGKQVRIQHAGGLTSSYAHMSSIAARSGAMVRRGDVIGRVGWTGLTTGPHLHYELSRNGRAVDPSSIAAAPVRVAEAIRPSEFERSLSRLLSVPVARPVAGGAGMALPTERRARIAR